MWEFLGIIRELTVNPSQGVLWREVYDEARHRGFSRSEIEKFKRHLRSKNIIMEPEDGYVKPTEMGFK